jgi:hypothetical protein
VIYQGTNNVNKIETGYGELKRKDVIGINLFLKRLFVG